VSFNLEFLASKNCRQEWFFFSMWKVIVLIDKHISFNTKLHIDIFVLTNFGFTIFILPSYIQHKSCQLLKEFHSQAKIIMGSVLSGLFPKLLAKYLGMSYVSLHFSLENKIHMSKCESILCTKQQSFPWNSRSNFKLFCLVWNLF